MRTDDIGREIRHAFRSLARTRATTSAAALTLACGLALSALGFALARGVWLRPLAFPEPERLVTLSNAIPAARVAAFPLSPPELQAYGDDEAFERLAGWQTATFNLGGVDDPIHLSGARVTPGFFEVLDVRAVRGRLPAAADPPGRGPAPAVISEGLWRDALAGDPAVLGRRILLDGVPHDVVAVLPDRLAFPREARTWTLLAFEPAVLGSDGLGRQSVRAVARLPDRLPPEEAGARLAARAADFHRLHADFYGEPSEWRTEVRSMVEVERARMGPPVLLVAAAAALLLLIAVVNVSGLLAARGLDRRGEVAVRVALGADRWAVLRVPAAEGLALGLVAGAAGLGAAVLAMPAVLRLGPPELAGFPVGVGGPVALVVAALAVATGVGAALVPAVRTSRLHPAGLLRGGPGRGGRPHRLRSALVAVQVAGTFVLLAGAFGLSRRFAELRRVDPGFQVAGAMTARTALPAATVPAPTEAVGDVLAALRSAPGVTAAGAVSELPLAGRDSRAAFYLDDETVARPPGTTSLHRRFATPGYREALGLELVAGRWIGEGDGPDAPSVVVVSRTFAERVWPGRDPLGRRIGPDPGGPWTTVVGVVEDVRHAGLDAPALLEAFYPLAQAPDAQARDVTLVVRSTGDATALLPTLRGTMAARLPDQPLFDVRTLEDVVRESLGGRRLSAALPTAFGLLALALSSFAVYGAARAAAVERAAELAVRQAMGASPLRLLARMVRIGIGPVAAGLGAGAAAVLLLGPGLATVSGGASAAGTGGVAGAAGALMAAGLAGSGVVALRVLREDPARVIRAA